MLKTLRTCAAAACAVAALAAIAAPAVAGVPDFFGTWRPSSPNVRDITRVDVRQAGGRIYVHVWGACQPVDCDWGEVAGRAYAPDVGAPLWPSADLIVAQFDKPMEQTTVELRPAGGGLNYQALTSFQYGSGFHVNVRSDYHHGGRLYH